MTFDVPDYRSVGAALADGIPSELGFRMPAEWEPHERTVMVFPGSHNLYRGRGSNDWYGDACLNWSNVVRAVAEFEPVLVIAHEGEAAIARKWCGEGVDVVEMPMNDPWARDNGPALLVDGKGRRAASGYVFNCLGEDNNRSANDALLKARIASHLGLPIFQSGLVTEGGAFTVDGQGTLITTETCMLNPNRNGVMPREEVERHMCEQLGVTKVIWLESGLMPDPITNGHVDGICAFVAPGRVVVHFCEDSSDVNAAICAKAKADLEQVRDARGRKLEIVELPLAGEVAHMNFYIANGGVVVPTCGDRVADDRSLGVIAELFPDRKVVGVESVTIAQGGGGIHCITQQVPAA